MLISTRLLKIFHCNRGAVAPAFAIMLPVILGMMMLGIDSTNILAQKTRFTRALDEGNLAIAATGIDNITAADKQQSEAIIQQYLKYYLPNATLNYINIYPVTSNRDNNGKVYREFSISASVNIPYLFDTGAIPGFSKNIEINSARDTIRKYYHQSTDYVLLIDFSHSREKMDIIKSVVKEVSDKILASDPQNKIAIVPYAVGVPVKLGKNERGGVRMGCSLLFSSKGKYPYDIDYEFWGDKYIKYLGSDPWFRYQIGMYRYQYYNNYIGASFPKMSNSDVINKWCTVNAKYGSNSGIFKYNCKSPDLPTSDLFSARSQRALNNELANADRVANEQGSWGTVMHYKALNFSDTVGTMFTDENIKTIPLSWPVKTEHRPFYSLCQNAGGLAVNQRDFNLTTIKPNSWLIELTNDINEIDEFQSMKTGAQRSQKISGLLRSVSVMMKGENPRKVFIIVSAGADNIYNKHLDETDKILYDHRLCYRIITGLNERSKSPNPSTEMYYISTKLDYDDYIKWSAKCTERSFMASNLTKDRLLSIFNGIVNEEAGHLYF